MSNFKTKEWYYSKWNVLTSCDMKKWYIKYTSGNSLQLLLAIIFWSRNVIFYLCGRNDVEISEKERYKTKIWTINIQWIMKQLYPVLTSDMFGSIVLRSEEASKFNKPHGRIGKNCNQKKNNFVNYPEKEENWNLRLASN